MMMDEPKTKSARDYEEEFNALCLKNEEEDDGEEYRLYYGAAMEEEDGDEEREEEEGWSNIQEEECFLFHEDEEEEDEEEEEGEDGLSNIELLDLYEKECMAEMQDLTVQSMGVPVAATSESMDVLESKQLAKSGGLGSIGSMNTGKKDIVVF